MHKHVCIQWRTSNYTCVYTMTCMWLNMCGNVSSLGHVHGFCDVPIYVNIMEYVTKIRQILCWMLLIKYLKINVFFFFIIWQLVSTNYMCLSNGIGYVFFLLASKMFQKQIKVLVFKWWGHEASSLSSNDSILLVYYNIMLLHNCGIA